MNPFLENDWSQVHTALIGYMWDTLGSQLPDDLVARPEERLTIDSIEPGDGYRADIGITETWKEGIAPSWSPGINPGGGITVAEPEIVRVDEEMERWIEIRTADGQVVTVIELLSPANKDSGRSRYKLKQHDYLQSSTSLVELDLLRGGRFTLPVPADHARRRDKSKGGTCYHICSSRAWRPDVRELYTCPLRERLPAIRIPLRREDQDIVLDIQPLIDRCYQVGRYYMGRFDQDPEPPFPPEEAAWVDERLKAAGLRA